MKTTILATIVLLASLNLRAQTNSAPIVPPDVKAGEAAKAPASQTSQPAASQTPAPIPARPRSAPVPAPAQKMPGKSEVRSQAESKTIQNLADALAAQRPSSAKGNLLRASGVFPEFAHAVKTRSNPFQLINPFAPLSKEESESLTEHTHVLYDPKTQTGPGLDFFSIDF